LFILKTRIYSIVFVLKSGGNSYIITQLVHDINRSKNTSLWFIILIHQVL